MGRSWTSIGQHVYEPCQTERTTLSSREFTQPTICGLIVSGTMTEGYLSVYSLLSVLVDVTERWIICLAMITKNTKNNKWGKPWFPPSLCELRFQRTEMLLHCWQLRVYFLFFSVISSPAELLQQQSWGLYLIRQREGEATLLTATRLQQTPPARERRLRWKGKHRWKDGRKNNNTQGFLEKTRRFE